MQIILNNKGFLAAFFIALAGGMIFTVLQLPIPWLLGSLTAILAASRFIPFKLEWPRKLRDAGILMIGYSIGLSFTKDAVIQMSGKLPSMLAMTLLTIAFSVLLAIIVSRISGIDFPTVLTGSIPGGLSQMLVFAEESEGIDLTTVTFLQVARLLMIVFFVPFLVLGPLLSGEAGPASIMKEEIPGWSALFPDVIPFVAASLTGAYLGRKLRLPTPYLLGPIVSTALIGIFYARGPALPPSLLDLSQFFIGAHIGLLMRPEKLHHKTKTISLALLSGALLIGISLLLSTLLAFEYNLSSATSFLSLAPGGMDQMGILAHEVHADLATVTGYQLFRIFFIFFAVPPALRWYFRRRTYRRTVKRA